MSKDQFSIKSKPNLQIKDFDEIGDKMLRELEELSLPELDNSSKNVAALFDSVDKSTVIKSLLSDTPMRALPITLYTNFSHRSYMEPYTLKNKNQIDNRFTLIETEGVTMPFLPEGRRKDGSIDMNYYNTEETIISPLNEDVIKYLFQNLDRFSFPMLLRMRVLLLSFRMTIGAKKFNLNPYMQMLSYYLSLVGYDAYYERQTKPIFNYTDPNKDPIDMMVPTRVGLLVIFAFYYEMYGKDYLYDIDTFIYIFQNPYVNGGKLKKILSNVKFLFCTNTTEGIGVQYDNTGTYVHHEVYSETEYLKSQADELVIANNELRDLNLNTFAKGLLASTKAPLTNKNLVKYSFYFNSYPVFGRSSVLIPLVNKLTEFDDVVIDTNNNDYVYFQQLLVNLMTEIFDDVFKTYGYKDEKVMRRELLTNVRPASFGESKRIFYDKFAKDPKNRFSLEPNARTQMLSSSQQSFIALFYPELLAKSIKFKSFEKMDLGLRDGSRFVPGGKEARTVLVSPSGTGFLGGIFADVYLSAKKYFAVLNTTGNVLRDNLLVIKACQPQVLALASDFSNFDGSQNDTNVFNALSEALEAVIKSNNLDVVMYDNSNTVGEFIRQFIKRSFTFPITFQRKPLVLDKSGVDQGVDIDLNDPIGSRAKLKLAYPDAKLIFNFLSSGNKLTLLLNSIATKAITSVIIDRIHDAGISLNLIYNEAIGDDSITLFQCGTKITSEIMNTVRQIAADVSANVGFSLNPTKTGATEFRAEFIQNFDVQQINVPKPITSPITLEGPADLDQLEKAKALKDKFFGSIFRNTFSYSLTKMMIFICSLSFFRIFSTQINKSEFYQIPISYLFLPEPFGLGIMPTFTTSIPSQFYTLKSLSEDVFKHCVELSFQYQHVNNRADSVREILETKAFSDFNDKIILPAFGERVETAQRAEAKLKKSGFHVAGFDISSVGRSTAKTIGSNLPKKIYIGSYLRPFLESKYIPFENIDLTNAVFETRFDMLDLLPYEVIPLKRPITKISSFAYYEQSLSDLVSTLGLSLEKPFFPGPRANLANSILKKIDPKFAGSFTDESIIKLLRYAGNYKKASFVIAANLVASGYDDTKAGSAANALLEKFSNHYTLGTLPTSIFNEFTQKLDISHFNLRRFFNARSFTFFNTAQFAYAIVATELLSRGPHIHIEFDVTNESELAVMIRNNKLKLF
jgi:hypothetical protein